jgi:hypothetical protein
MQQTATDKLDDLRKRVDAWGPFDDATMTGDARLIRDLWRAVQERDRSLKAEIDISYDLRRSLRELQIPLYEPVTAEELDAIIDGSQLGGDGSDIIRQLGPLSRQRKTMHCASCGAVTNDGQCDCTRYGNPQLQKLSPYRQRKT